MNRIIYDLAAVGEKLSYDSLKKHRLHAVEPEVDLIEDPLKVEKQRVIKKLMEDAARAPVTLAAFYHLLIRWHQGDEKVSDATAMKAAEAITRITGMRTKQEFLLGYMESRFNQPGIEAPVQAELLQVDGPDDSS